MKTFKNYPAGLLICGLALLAIPASFAGHDEAAKFKMMDTNNDGRVSRAEHVAGAQQMFAKLDTNVDGVITTAEMDAGQDLKAHSKSGDKKNAKSAQEKIALIDTNADGMLSRAEHEAGAEKIFTKMDTDSDGYLSKDECEDGHKMMKKDK